MKSPKPADPKSCTYVEKPQPSPGPGEVLIKAEAIGMNFIDTYFRSGQYPREVPFIVGIEVCGTVEAVGEDVAALGVGDRVVTAQANGAYAEYCTAPADFCAYVPDGVSPDVAAASLLKGMTAHYLIKSVYPVQQGDTVLVHAGAGGVGLILTQWATSLAVRVITTVSTPEKAELSRQAGAVEVLDYPEDPEEFGAKIKELTDGGVAAVYDGVGAATFDASLASLRDPRHARAVRRVQRAGPAVRPAAAQRGRFAVPDPADAGALHPHAPTSSLGAQANCSTRSPPGRSPSRSASATASKTPSRPTATCRAARPSARSCWCPETLRL